MAARVTATTTQGRWRLVLSAGGTLGAYWMIGALQALEEAGLDPRTAEVIVGTSAGSVLAGMLACGHLPWVPIEAQQAAPFEVARATEVAGGRWWEIRPGLGLLRSGLLPPYDVGLPALVGGLLPEGRFLTDHIQGLVWRHVESASGELHRGVRIVAVDRSNGRRTVFGSRPASRLPAAVAASCAIPGWFAPVRIGSRSYIDGGVHSVFNLDLALEGRSAPVIVLSALSGPVPISLGPAWLGMRVFRGTIGLQLGRAVRSARRGGRPVHVVEPGAEETVAMGRDLMNGAAAEAVYRAALTRTRERLDSATWRERLAPLLGAASPAA